MSDYTVTPPRREIEATKKAAGQKPDDQTKKPLRREAGRAEMKMLGVVAAMFADCQ